MKKVLIKIKGTQGPDAEGDAVEFMTNGVIKKTAADDLVLSYDDNRILSDMPQKSVKTRITVQKNDKVTIERAGEVNSRIIIEKGVRNSCFYNVSNLDLTLGIYGKTFKSDLSEDGGRVSMTYSVDSNLRHISENTIEITVKEVN